MINQFKEQFLHPHREFTPIPFWFWNDTLTEDELLRQIDDFNSKGVNGFVIHPRMGLPKEIGYLTDEYMNFVRFAVEKAAERNMVVVLYDEASYPSGSAHGLVVKANPAFASKGLRMSSEDKINDNEVLVKTLWIRRNEEKVLEVETRETPGYDKYNFIMQYSHGTIRGVHFGEDDLEPDAPKSADLLSAESTKMFLSITHERYYECLKEYFGKTVIGFFTDEPSIMGRCHDEGLIPWTNGFLEYFIARGGKVTDLPFLFLEGNDDAKQIYHDAVNKKLGENYYSPLSDWCAEHGIALTGHPGKSDDIAHLRYFHIPCQDIVWRYVAPDDGTGLTGSNSTMGKCSSDAARHLGRRRNGNEAFGCCGPQDDLWAFTFEDMMWYLNWLFVRGNNLIFPHAFFYSLRDERRDERPPDVGPNSPWWKEYNKVSDYIKRMCQLITDTKNAASVAIICREDSLPWEPARPLFESQLEFNYLEAGLLERCRISDKIKIEKQEYSALVIDDPDALSPEEIRLLNKFSGLKILYKCNTDVFENFAFAGTDEEFVNIIKANTPTDFSLSIPCPDLRVTHLIKDNVDFYILSNEGDNEISFSVPFKKGEVWDAWEGTFSEFDGNIRLSGRQLLVLVP